MTARSASRIWSCVGMRPIVAGVARGPAWSGRLKTDGSAHKAPRRLREERVLHLPAEICGRQNLPGGRRLSPARRRGEVDCRRPTRSERRVLAGGHASLDGVLDLSRDEVDLRLTRLSCVSASRRTLFASRLTRRLRRWRSSRSTRVRVLLDLALERGCARWCRGARSFLQLTLDRRRVAVGRADGRSTVCATRSRAVRAAPTGGQDGASRRCSCDVVERRLGLALGAGRGGLDVASAVRVRAGAPGCGAPGGVAGAGSCARFAAVAALRGGGLALVVVVVRPCGFGVSLGMQSS